MNFLARKKHHIKGLAMMFVTLCIALMLAGAAVFLKRSSIFSTSSNIEKDSLNSEYQLEAAYESAKSKLARAVLPIQLGNNKLPYTGRQINGVAITNESYNTLVNAYSSGTPGVVGNELGFLQDVILTEAMNSTGTVDNTNEFASFAKAFPTSWTTNSASGNAFQIQYAFNPLPLVNTLSPTAQIVFEYEYNIKIRSYGQSRFTETAGEDAGIIRILVTGAPFSQWALFRSQTTVPSGSAIFFAGGDTTAQIQDVFSGPVQTNQAPNFYGHPTFNDMFKSAAATSSWNQQNGAGYSGSALFNGGSSGSASNSITMPSSIFNVVRLAAGDTGVNAAENNATVTQANLLNFLANYAGGSMPNTATSVPQGIYVPVSNQSTLIPTGGIYVEGDAQISLSVNQGSSQFPASQWSQISTADQACKYQGISITPMKNGSVASGVSALTIYMGASSGCTNTYVFNTTSGAAPTVLPDRLNGNIHVDGSITSIGGASRTAPSIALNTQLTVSAASQVLITNDIQYEDVQYVLATPGSPNGTTVIANASGQVGNSAILNTAENVAPTISNTSSTVFGLISLNSSVLLSSTAPSNINLDASIYAANPNAYNSSTGYGCGSGSYAGCGFGAVNFNTETGKGAIKLLGSISEYQSQAVGTSTPTGYQKQYTYDTRLKKNIMPPGFPVSSQLQAFGTIEPIHTWRISKAIP